MGHSNTGKHAEGPRLFGPDAVWPTPWRARWAKVRAETERRFRTVRVAASPMAGRSLRDVLADQGLAGTLRAFASRYRVDEADVARVWASCDGGDARETAKRVRERLRLVRSLEAAVGAAAKAERLRMGVATRNHLRILALTASLTLGGGSRAERVRRFLEKALPERIG